MTLNKVAIWLAGTAMTAVIGLIATGITWWVGQINKDHETLSQISVLRINEDHETLKQLYWKDQFLNGPLREAPVDAPTK